MPPLDGDIKDVLDNLGKNFEEFKQQNDARLKQIESKGSADPITEETVDKINKAISAGEAVKAAAEKAIKRADDLEAEVNRLKELGNGSALDGKAITPEQKAHKEAFSAWLRKGAKAEDGLSDLQAKAMSVGTPADGGYAVPTTLDTMITEQLRDRTPMRGLCTVVTVSDQNFEKLVKTGSNATGWVAETAARPATDTSQLAKAQPVWGEVYANPQITQRMLEDAAFNVEAWISGDLAMEFSEAENAAFTAGDGSDKPKGLVAYATSFLPDATRAYNAVQIVPSLKADGIKSAATGDEIDIMLSIVHALRAPYRQNANWMMNDSTIETVRKFKDDNGQLYWQPSVQLGVPSTFLGYGVESNEDMPDLGTNALSIAFGDFARAYWIFDRVGTTMLRDPYSNKPYVGFYTTKRVGGMLNDAAAVKVMKCTTSTSS